MDEIVATAFWRRLDTDGHDACRLIRTASGWRLAGCAVFVHEGAACMLGYRVDCDAAWRTLSARVDGSVGFDSLALGFERSGEDWRLDGAIQPEAAGCIDLDLGFTPATNLLAIRRLSPAFGRKVATPAAYYREFSRRLGVLGQTYARTGETTFAYESPAHGFAAELTVHPVGFVTDYPGLWSGSVRAA